MYPSDMPMRSTLLHKRTRRLFQRSTDILVSSPNSATGSAAETTDRLTKLVERVSCSVATIPAYQMAFSADCDRSSASQRLRKGAARGAFQMPSSLGSDAPPAGATSRVRGGDASESASLPASCSRGHSLATFAKVKICSRFPVVLARPDSPPTAVSGI